MPWIIGVDEAGYGPNLGPFVMSAVAFRVPLKLAQADLWAILADAVRRADEPDDGRPLVADSKLVYTPARGLAALETGVLAALSPLQDQRCSCLDVLVGALSDRGNTKLREERWYTGTSLLPILAGPAECAAAGEGVRRCCNKQRIGPMVVRSVVVCPAQFNEMLQRWDTKGAVLAWALAELVGDLRATGGTDALHFAIDKHGGRNFYAALLQSALPDGMIVACEEGAACSRYQALGLEREISLTFEPRADAQHFCVALASMVSKYLRELLMLEFNRFWQSHIPGLEPTAGYPGDAGRFFEAIRPAMNRLGIPEQSIWRPK